MAVSSTSSGEGRLRDDVRHDGDALGGAVVGIEDADAADEGVQGAGEGNVGDVAVGTGGGAADDDGVGRGAQGHCGVFGLTLADFVDQDNDFAV
jgi:hypothetical protein